MTVFERGDWVVHDPGYKREVGRVLRVGEKCAFVCYSSGCTAAATPLGMLRPYDPARDRDLARDPSIGHHRFDAECPDRDPECCFDCHAREVGR